MVPHKQVAEEEKSPSLEALGAEAAGLPYHPKLLTTESDRHAFRLLSALRRRQTRTPPRPANNSTKSPLTSKEQCYSNSPGDAEHTSTTRSNLCAASVLPHSNCEEELMRHAQVEEASKSTEHDEEHACSVSPAETITIPKAPPCPTNDSTKSPLTSKEQRDNNSPVETERSESECSISADSQSSLAANPRQASKKRVTNWSGYKLMCSHSRHRDEAHAIGVQPTALGEYAEYIGRHGHIPPKLPGAPGRMKKRKSPGSNFLQTSKNNATVWNDLLNKVQREEYTKAALQINDWLSRSDNRMGV
jgi:hypothetical protein